MNDFQHIFAEAATSGVKLWVHKHMDLGYRSGFEFSETLQLYSQFSPVFFEVTGPPGPLKLRHVFASKIWSCQDVEV